MHQQLQMQFNSITTQTYSRTYLSKAMVLLPTQIEIQLQAVSMFHLALAQVVPITEVLQTLTCFPMQALHNKTCLII
jgi:hypothetical protein